MDFFQERFPTPALQRAELRMRSLVQAQVRHFSQESLGELPTPAQVQALLALGTAFHERYELWHHEAMRQNVESVRCGPGCANCCQHYPLSVEPFESIRLYAALRQRDDWGRILEECYRRVQVYQGICHQLQHLRESMPEEDWEDQVLHEYFSRGYRCPILDEKGCCSAHHYRPVTCRMYLSYTDPAFCTPKHLQGPENRSFHICLPDDLEEDLADLHRLIGVWGLGESLYASLLALNAWEGYGVFP